MTPEVQRLEALAERLRGVDPAVPSPATKIRGWNLVLAGVQQSATAHTRAHSVRRLVLAAFAAVVLLVAGTLAASADSLPDSPLYGLKGVVEQARGALAFSPSDQLRYHLDLAQTRLTEAEAMIARHRVDLADQALNALGYQLAQAGLLVQMEKQRDPALGADMENQLEQAIATHDRQLAGLQGQVTNPTALSAITLARDRAAAALQTAAASTGTGGNANGKGTGNGTTLPHPTPKH